MSGDHNMNQKPVAWQVMVEDEAMKEFPIKDMAHDWCVHQKLSGSPYSYWIRPLYTNPPAAPRQEQYDQTALELCEECGWKAIIPGDGCLVCARQKAKPVAWMYDFLADDRDEVIRDWVTQSQDDIKRENGFNVRPLYTAPRQWVELTDDEARALVNRATFGDRTNWQALVYMVDAKLKEKNHG